jgi:hypothetical protein
MSNLKKKVRIITADFGNHYKTNYDYLLPEQKTNKYEIDFVCYNDNNTISRKNSLNTRTKSKIPKMLDWLENDADYYIWFDSSFTITSNDFVDIVIDFLGDYDICIHNHAYRSSIKIECDFVLHHMNRGHTPLIVRYDGERMLEQVNFYLEDKTFVDNKLFEMGFFVYSKNLILNKNYNLLTDWFFHNCYWSIQDQLSFPYLLHKHNVKYKTFETNIYSSDYIKHGY